MPIIKYDALEASKVEMEGAENVSKKVPIGQKEGWNGYTMRTFTIGPGGHSPKHSHDWEHEVFILEGEGKIVGDSMTLPLCAGDAGFVPCGENHYFENTGEQTMKMLCIIPSVK